MKYYIALFQKLKDTYLSQSSQQNDSVLICPSLRLYEMEDLELLKPQSQLKDTSKTADAILRKQQASYELNSLPGSGQFWDLNPSNSLFDAYRDILNYAKVKNLEEGLKMVAESEKSKLYADGKPTKEYKAYLKSLEKYNQKLIEIDEHLKLYETLTTDEERLNWNEQLAILKSGKEQALASWNTTAYKSMIEDALKAVNKLSDTDIFLDLFQTVKNNFSAAEKTDVTSLSAIHDINFIPYDFMDDESGWTYVFLDKNELENLFSEAKRNTESIPEEILDIEYDEKYIESIEFDFAFIHLKRGWFNKEIFNSEHFLWNENQPISDGVTISNTFKLPAFPKTMLLIKNLKINLNDSVSETQVDNQNQIIRFGPMILKHQLFVNKNTKQRFLKTVTNKNVIKSDQMNYLIRKADESEILATKTLSGETTVMNRMLLRRSLPGLVTRKERLNPKESSMVIPKRIDSSLIRLKRRDLFVKIDNTPVISVTSVIFNITDSNSKKGIYKCSLSIRGADNNRIFEIETNENGQITASVPVGSYTVEARSDGYDIFNSNFSVVNTNPLTLSYSLNRKEIKFKSYFLIGMVCERIPKVPR